MQWETNKYYPLYQAKPDATVITTSLLHAYPLTGACLETLGQNLINRIEFGFFTEGTDIIRQGESGKDLFLLCHGLVDVLVNGQVVVKMDAPTLLGDKAIVEPQSKRAATIRISAGHLALFIKIPMGVFIRDFSDQSIDDDQFGQELRIFCNVFVEIQKRLFGYIYLQKNLWEEANTTLNLINTQVIAKSLDNKKEMNWDSRVWDAAKRWLLANTKFAWPNNIPLTTSNFRDVLYQLLERKFTRKMFKGTNADYLARKHLLWRGWLLQASESVIKEFPPEKLPIHIGDVELFNPRNYHMRTSKLLRSAEKKFPVRQTQPTSILDTQVQSVEVPPVSSFFGKGDHSNEFELQRYLSSFESTFVLKHPKRLQAQMAQRTALIAAECENQFNASVAKMQKFLEKAKSKALATPPQQSKTEVEGQQMLKWVTTLLKSFGAYNRQTHMMSDQNILGQVQFLRGFTPNIDNLVKCSAVKSTRTEIERAFQQVVTSLGMGPDRLPAKVIKQNLFLVEAGPADIVPYSELRKHYWVPVSEGIALLNEDGETMKVKPGMILGGKGWAKNAKAEDEDSNFSLRVPERKETDRMDLSFLLCVFPLSEFSWEIDNDPSPEQYVKAQLPVMQWIIDKHVEHIAALIEQRDRAFQKWFEIVQVIRLEKKVKEFETTRIRLTPQVLQVIQRLLATTIGLEINVQQSAPSDQLAKKIYNHILRQMGEQYPDMPVEERSNKAYTKWRFILSEIVQNMGAFGKEDDAGVYNPKPVFDILNTEIASVVETYLGDQGSEYNHLSGEEPSFDFASLAKQATGMKISMRIMLFKLISSIFETHLRRVTQEMYDYETRLAKASEQRPQMESDSVKLELILEDIEKLRRILGAN